MKVKYFRREHLDKALYDAGIVGRQSYAYRWILSKEKKGKLKIQKDSSGMRRMSEKQIKQIVEAFKMGGKGFWSFESR